MTPYWKHGVGRSRGRAITDIASPVGVTRYFLIVLTLIAMYPKTAVYGTVASDSLFMRFRRMKSIP